MKNLNWKFIFIVVFTNCFICDVLDRSYYCICHLTFWLVPIYVKCSSFYFLAVIFACSCFQMSVTSQAIVIPASIHQSPQDLGTMQLSRAAIFMILQVFKHLIQDSCWAEATFRLRHRILVLDLDLKVKLNCSVLFEGYLDLWCTSIHSISSKKLYFLFDYLFVCFL